MDSARNRPVDPHTSTTSTGSNACGLVAECCGRRAAHAGSVPSAQGVVSLVHGAATVVAAPWQLPPRVCCAGPA
jgi:hypothetical protein